MARALDLPATHPRAVLAVFALLSALLLAGIPRLMIDSSIESMIVEGDADHLAFENRKETFGGDEVVALAIPFGDAFDPQSLSLLKTLARRIQATEGVERVDSIVNTNDIFGRGDSVFIEPLVPPEVDPREMSEPDLRHLATRVQENPIWSRLLVSSDNEVVALQIKLERIDTSPVDRGATVSAIQQTAREVLGDIPFFLAGHPYMKTEIAATMQRDLGTFLPVTIAIMAGFLAICVRSVWLVSVTLGSVLLATLWMLGFMGWVGQPLTALSNTGPTILLALATAYFLHLVASYQRESRPDRASTTTARLALDRIRRPTLIAGLTTAVGFASLTGSSIPLVAGFGVDLVAGMLAVLLIGLFALPALLALGSSDLPATALGQGTGLGTSLFAIARVDSRYPRPIVALALFALGLAVLMATRLELDSSGPKAFAEDSDFRVAADFYRERLGGDVVGNVYLRAHAGTFEEPEILRRVAALQREAEALPQVDKTVSIADYLRVMNRAFHGGLETFDIIPDSTEAVAQYLFIHSDPEELDDFVNEDRSEARILVRATVLSSQESAALRARLRGLADRFLGGSTISRDVLSTEILLSKAADELALEQAKSFAVALVIILLVVTAAFASVWVGALLLLPNCLPIAMNFGTMTLVGIPLSQATAIIAVTALGIAVDGTVHLVSSIRQSEMATGSRTTAVAHSLATTGRPVVITGLIVIVGYAVLALSGFRMISDLGALTALTIGFCLLADLFILPAQILARSAGAAGRDGSKAILLTSQHHAAPATIIETTNGEMALRIPGGAPPDYIAGGSIQVRSMSTAAPQTAKILRFLDSETMIVDIDSTFLIEEHSR